MKILKFSFKSIIVHTFTYFVFGLIMSNLFDYEKIFQMEIIKDFMRDYSSPMILFGPLLQPIRGFIFALAIWPIRKIIIDQKYGWLILWNIIVLIGILSTPSASPASIEGVIYSKLPLWYHFLGFPELLMQSFCFSYLLVKWENGRLNKIFSLAIVSLTILILIIIILGIIMM